MLTCCCSVAWIASSTAWLTTQGKTQEVSIPSSASGPQVRYPFRPDSSKSAAKAEFAYAMNSTRSLFKQIENSSTWVSGTTRANPHSISKMHPRHVIIHQESLPCPVQARMTTSKQPSINRDMEAQKAPQVWVKVKKSTLETIWLVNLGLIAAQPHVHCQSSYHAAKHGCAFWHRNCCMLRS